MNSLGRLKVPFSGEHSMCWPQFLQIVFVTWLASPVKVSTALLCAVLWLPCDITGRRHTGFLCNLCPTTSSPLYECMLQILWPSFPHTKWKCLVSKRLLLCCFEVGKIKYTMTLFWTTIPQVMISKGLYELLCLKLFLLQRWEGYLPHEGVKRYRLII